MILLCHCCWRIPDWLRDSDLAGAAFGSLLGFGLAWLLLQYQFKRERQRALKEHHEELDRYYDEAVELLKRACRGWRSSGIKYGALAGSYESEWYKQFPHPTTVNVAEITLNRFDRMLLRDAFIKRLGRRRGRSAYGVLVSLVDYYQESRPYVEEAILSIKKEIALRSDRFDELQIEIGMALSQSFFRLRSEGRHDDAIALEFTRIMEGIHPFVVDINKRPTPKDIFDLMVVPCLELRRKGFHAADIEEILDAAKRTQRAYFKYKSASEEMVHFARLEAERTARQVLRATALLNRCGRAKS